MIICRKKWYPHSKQWLVSTWLPSWLPLWWHLHQPLWLQHARWYRRPMRRWNVDFSMKVSTGKRNAEKVVWFLVENTSWFFIIVLIYLINHMMIVSDSYLICGEWNHSYILDKVQCVFMVVIFFIYRDLETTVFISSPENLQSCIVLIKDIFPSGSYVDPNQLRFNKAFGGPDFHVPQVCNVIVSICFMQANFILCCYFFSFHSFIFH